MNKVLKIATQTIFLLLSINLSGQIQYVITPFNSTQITTDIIDDFQHLIGISSNQLETHLISLIDSSIYCAACPNTDLNIQDNAPNSLFLSWAPVTNADFYEIDYLNLATGASSSIIESGTSTTLNSLPNGAYAFSISTYSSSSGDIFESPGHIIVEETPILIEEWAQDCSCPFKAPQYFTEDGITWTWDAVEETRYVFDITFDGRPESMKLILLTSPEEEGSPLDFRIECQEGLIYQYRSNTFFPDPENINIQMHFTYTDSYHLTFYGDPSLIETLDLNICTDPPEGRDGDGHRLVSTEKTSSINIFPNPAQDKLWISSVNKFEQLSVITIYNQIGQEMIHRRQQTTKEFIDIRNWPNGIYTIKIKTADKINTQSFLKIN